MGGSVRLGSLKTSWFENANQIFSRHDPGVVSPRNPGGSNSSFTTRHDRNCTSRNPVRIEAADTC